jgi:prepilin-type N-terminal cleavage/methylation domain-containing protein
MNQITSKNRLLRSQQGFTIIEIVVVIVLMLLVLYPLARVMASSLESTTNEQHLTHCAFLAQMKIEETRTSANCFTNHVAALAVDCPFSSGSMNDFNQLLSQTPPACTFPAPLDGYKCKVEYGDAVLSRLKYIQVRVWYDRNNDNVYDPDNNEPSVFLETLLTQRHPSWL